MIDWKAFLLAYAILIVIYVVARLAEKKFDRWLDKIFKDKK